jgi:hypothetical protein
MTFALFLPMAGAFATENVELIDVPAVMHKVVLAEKKASPHNLNFVQTATDIQKPIQFTAPADLVSDLLKGLVEKDMLSIMTSPQVTSQSDTRKIIVSGNEDSECTIELFSQRRGDAIATLITFELMDKKKPHRFTLSKVFFLLPDTTTVTLVHFGGKEYLLAITAWETELKVPVTTPVTAAD